MVHVHPFSMAMLNNQRVPEGNIIAPSRKRWCPTEASLAPKPLPAVEPSHRESACYLRAETSQCFILKVIMYHGYHIVYHGYNIVYHGYHIIYYYIYNIIETNKLIYPIIYHCYIIDISFIYYIIDILSLYHIYIYIGGWVKIRVWIGQRCSKRTDRSGSPAFWYGRVWIGGMDRPVGSGYGSGLYISTRSLYIYIYIYSLWIQTPPEKVLNPPNHTPNTS